MARNTRRSCQVNRDRFFSMKLLPAARTMSATSKGGAFISCAVCGSASLAQAQTVAVCRVGCPPLLSDVRKGEGKWRSLSGQSDQAATAPWADPLLLPPSELRNYVAYAACGV